MKSLWDVEKLVKRILKQNENLYDDDYLKDLWDIMEGYFLLSGDFESVKIDNVVGIVPSDQFKYAWNFIKQWYLTTRSSDTPLNICKVCQVVKPVNNFGKKSNTCKNCISYRVKQLRGMNALLIKNGMEPISKKRPTQN